MVTEQRPVGGKLVAAMMRDGDNFHQGWSFANSLYAAAKQEVVGLQEAELRQSNIGIDIAILARESVIAVLRQHGCYMSDENSREIDEKLIEMISDEDPTNGDLAIRTCLCGKAIDGTDEYNFHLIEVFSER